MVVNGVTKEEQAADGRNNGSTAGVLAVKVAVLDSTATTLGGRALGEALVEVDDGLHAGAVTAGARERARGGDLGGHGERRGEAHLANGAGAASGRGGKGTEKHFGW